MPQAYPESIPSAYQEQPLARQDPTQAFQAPPHPEPPVPADHREGKGA
jgi:hypothetical protein